ncbi:hypothetical protein NIES4074_22350 [Cylindrospermum sp. NIES-4074]|nr:hypothetical protein NIES4074_22350 [Cylindrospermum sp. NIES-4074]
MNDLDEANSLKSAGVGSLLVRLLWVRLGLDVVSTLFSLLQLAAPPLYQLLSILDGLISIGALIITLTSFIVFLIWLYRLHIDLKNYFQEYPIKPGGAVARFLIPIYSLWGMSNTLTTFADKFKVEGGDLTRLGEQVRGLIAPLYGFTIGLNVVNRIVFTKVTQSPEDNFLPVWILLSSALDIGLTLVILQLTKTMQTAINQQAKRALF